MALLDQYGRPQPKGMGGGYKKVDGDGYGKSVYQDYDPVTGILRHLIFNGDGTVTTKAWQNVEAMADVLKTVKNEFRTDTKRLMERQAVIPILEHQKIMERCGYKPGKAGGEYDRKKFDQIINDPDYAAFRTRPGRISVQHKVWY